MTAQLLPLFSPLTFLTALLPLVSDPRLFFQANTSNTMCRRNLLFNYQTPTLQWLGKVQLYHLPERRPVTIRCPQATYWISHTELLSEVGQILSASCCSITTNKFRTFLELHGEIQETIDTTQFYIPDQLSIVADHKIPLIQETSPEVTRPNIVKSKVMVPSQSFDVDSLFHIRRTSLHQAHQSYWHLIITTTVCAIAILSVLYISLRSYLRNMVSVVSLLTQIPNPVPRSKILLLYHLNQDKECTIHTLVTLAKTPIYCQPAVPSFHQSKQVLFQHFSHSPAADERLHHTRR